MQNHSDWDSEALDIDISTYLKAESFWLWQWSGRQWYLPPIWRLNHSDGDSEALDSDISTYLNAESFWWSVRQWHLYLSECRSNHCRGDSVALDYLASLLELLSVSDSTTLTTAWRKASQTERARRLQGTKPVRLKGHAGFKAQSQSDLRGMQASRRN